MVIYHESITYPYEFPVGMSYEDKFRICYHREPTKAEKRDIYPNIESRRLYRRLRGHAESLWNGLLRLGRCF